jgi:hypothetical protein
MKTHILSANPPAIVILSEATEGSDPVGKDLI